MQINGNVIIIRGSARCSDSLAANGNANGKYAYISKQRQAMSSVVVLVVVAVVVVVVAVLPFIICLIYSFALRAAPRRLESPLGSGQALEVAARFAWDALPAVLAEHLSRLLATHWAKGRGCFTRCKQMPRVYLVRVRMCNVPVAVAVASAVAVAVNAGDRAGCVELR